MSDGDTIQSSSAPNPEPRRVIKVARRQPPAEGFTAEYGSSLFGGLPALQTQEQREISRLAAELVGIRRDVERLADQGGANPADIEELRAKVTSAEASTAAIKAPVLMPTMQEMAVRLVPAATLHRFHEYHSDEATAQLWFGVLMGTLLGAVIGVIMQSPDEAKTTLTQPYIYIVAVLLCATAWLFHQQGERARSRQAALRASSEQLNVAIEGISSGSTEVGQ